MFKINIKKFNNKNKSKDIINKLFNVLFLALLFLIPLFLKIYFANEKYFPDNGSYFHMRQISHISKKLVPFFYDELSYSGRKVVLLPLFDYFMAFLNKIIPENINYFYTTKIISSLIAIFVFFIVRSFLKNDVAALFSACGVAFLPLLFGETIHSVTPLSFSIIINLLLIYLFVKIETKEKLFLYIITLIASILTSSLVLVFILSMWIFLIFSYTENFENKNRYFELGIFSTALVIWAYLIIFKDAIIAHGSTIFWQGTPLILLKDYLFGFNIKIVAYSTGSISFLAGLYIISKYLFRKKNDFFYMVFSIILATVILLFLKLISLKNGLIIMGINISILSGFFILEFSKFIEKTNFGKMKSLFLILIFSLLIINNLSLSLIYTKENIKNFVSEEKVKAMNYLKENSEEEAVIMSKIDYGNLITYYAQRKNVIDNNFLLAKDVQTRYYDIETVYKTIYSVEAIKIMNKYNAGYLLVDNNKEIPKYLKDNECFRLIYNNTIMLYKLYCKI